MSNGVNPVNISTIHRLMEEVLKLRLRVASLEKAQDMKLLDLHSGLNLSASSMTNVNGRRMRKAGLRRRGGRRSKQYSHDLIGDGTTMTISSHTTKKK
jgi:hypothetical protein